MLFKLLLSAHWILFNHPTTPVSLQDAVSRNLIHLSITSNPVGTHYQQPIVLHIKNITSSPLEIKIGNGQTFMPEDSIYQPILVIKDAIADVSPGNTTDIKIEGMCFNATKAAPHNEIKYKLGKPATGNLAKLAQYLHDNNLSSYSAQHAIWSISNNEPLEDIIDWDQTKAMDIMAYVAEITGRKMPDKAAASDYSRNLNTRPNPKVTIGGSFEFTLLKNTEIHIGMFDANGIVVRELYYNPSEKPGDHTFNYEFDASVFTDEVYYIRYLENKEIWMESKLTR